MMSVGPQWTVYVDYDKLSSRITRDFGLYDRIAHGKHDTLGNERKERQSAT